MADAVTTQIIVDGPRNAVVKLTSVSDGTGEAGVLKVDVSALEGAPGEVAIERILFTTNGMRVDLLWDATTDVLAWSLAPDMTDDLDFSCFGGLVNNSGVGRTGDIMLTTTGHSNGDSYSIVLMLRKKPA